MITGNRENLEDRIDLENPSRRGFLKGLAGAGVLAGLGGYVPKAFAKSRKLISDEARDRIWARDRFPEMWDLVNLINENRRLAEEGSWRTMRNYIRYAFYPDQGISNTENIAITTRKVPIEDMDTPHFWLLLRIRGYSYRRIVESEEDFKGIPPLPPHTGVWYFARGLKNKSPNKPDEIPTNESDLLKALYIGATGSPNGAEPIINGTFMNEPGVREKVREWKNEYNFAPYSDEGNHLLAYNSINLRKGSFPDNELAELSLLALEDFYDGVNSPERSGICMSVIIGLTKRNKLPRYSIINSAGAKSPLPVLKFNY